MKTVDVEQLIAEGRWDAPQKLLIFGTALTMAMTSCDYQLFGATGLYLSREWSMLLSELASMSSLSPIGLIFGSVLGGLLGDRIGRRPALLWSVLALAVQTLAMGMSWVPIFAGPAELQFLAGIGLGATIPNAIALAYEVAPRRKRGLSVILTMIGVPAGNLLATFMSAWISPNFGSRVPFILGGIASILLALLLFRALPESPLYLANRVERKMELATLLTRLGYEAPREAVFTDNAAGKMERPVQSIRDLFLPSFQFDTLGLLISFFSCMLANYIALSYFQVMMTRLPRVGFASFAATKAGPYWDFAVIGGVVLAAFAVRRFKYRTAMLGMSIVSIVWAIISTAILVGPSLSAFRLIVMLTLLGGLINAVLMTMYALAASAFPTTIRVAGIGTAAAIGRIGQLTAYYFAVLPPGGSAILLGVTAIAMTLTLGSLALVRRQTAPEHAAIDGIRSAGD